MLGAAGCIAPEVLAQFQPGFPEANNVAWFASGVIPPAGAYKGYWTDSMSLFFVEAIAMNFAELKRLQDFKYVHDANVEMNVQLVSSLCSFLRLIPTPHSIGHSSLSGTLAPRASSTSWVLRLFSPAPGTPPTPVRRQG